MSLWDDFIRQIPGNHGYDDFIKDQKGLLKWLHENNVKNKACSVCKYCHLKLIYEYLDHWEPHEYCVLDGRPTGYETPRKTCDMFSIRKESGYE